MTEHYYLERIASALESIAENLENLNNRVGESWEGSICEHLVDIKKVIGSEGVYDSLAESLEKIANNY